MAKKPKIILKFSDPKIKESGCCFRSCGGSPCILQEDVLNAKKNLTEKRLARIK